MAETYLWLKAVHVVAVISWMAGLLYLPRLFVYHAAASPDSDKGAMLGVMEQRLQRIIMLPAMIVTWLTGLTLAWMLATGSALAGSGWLAVKVLAVIALTVLHMRLAWHRNKFAAGQNTFSEKYFRMVNEAPTVLLIIIVVMVIVKPF
ncbi:MAG: protoporphyrinogen oxidase HemJ [Pseudomonadota bacterium]|nr:protoporphyrinogen oxidase HemJ [Pseudomonadota bacterium]